MYTFYQQNRICMGNESAVCAAEKVHVSYGVTFDIGEKRIVNCKETGILYCVKGYLCCEKSNLNMRK